MKLFLILVFLFNCLFADWKTERENLQYCYKIDNFRLFYSLSGKNQLKDKSDKNKNNIPDIIEDISTQLKISTFLIEKKLNLISPLKQKRYLQKNVKYIDIHFLNLSYSGNSGDSAILYNYKSLKNNDYSLSMALSNKLKADNLTPLHELMHAYLNGYTMFKNRWLTEGITRWSEYLLKDGTGSEKRLPKSILEINELLTRTYDAKYFWNRLFKLVSKKNKLFEINEKINSLTYLTTKSPIINGNKINGINFIKTLLENLDYYDDIVSRNKNFDLLYWKEKEQKNSFNNKYILLAIKKSILDLNLSKNKEILKLINSIDQYIKEYDLFTEIPDFTNKIKEIGIPYKKFYPNNTEHIYSRNVWDLKVFKNKLYFGAGNYGNSGPSPNSGPIPIISYNFKTNKFSEEFIIKDESINLFRVNNNILFVPGTDAVNNSTRSGNLYFYKNSKWKVIDNIPKALHIFDVTYHDNKIFCAISTSRGAGVAISENFGITWKVIDLGKAQRAFSLIEINNKLYIFKQYLSLKKQNKLYGNSRDNYFFVSEYMNGAIINRSDIKKNSIFNSSNDNRTIRISKSEKFLNKSAVLASYYYDNKYSFYILSDSINHNIDSMKLNLPEFYKPRDLIVIEDNLYLLASKKGYKKYENVLFKINYKNINKLNPIFKFSTSTFAESLEYYDGHFYFGLGLELKNLKKWKQKDLDENTGLIIKI